MRLSDACKRRISIDSFSKGNQKLVMLPFEESESWDYTYVLDAGVRSWKLSAENSGVDNSEGPYCASKAQLVDQGLPESESLLMVLTYGLLNLLQGGIALPMFLWKIEAFLLLMLIICYSQHHLSIL